MRRLVDRWPPKTFCTRDSLNILRCMRYIVAGGWFVALIVLYLYLSVPRTEARKVAATGTAVDVAELRRGWEAEIQESRERMEAALQRVVVKEIVPAPVRTAPFRREETAPSSRVETVTMADGGENDPREWSLTANERWIQAERERLQHAVWWEKMPLTAYKERMRELDRMERMEEKGERGWVDIVPASQAPASGMKSDKIFIGVIRRATSGPAIAFDGPSTRPATRPAKPNEEDADVTHLGELRHHRDRFSGSVYIHGR